VKIEIEKVGNGFLLTTTSWSAQPMQGFYAMPSSYKIPLEKHETKTVFEKWEDAQKFIRKNLGVCE
jgi:hypothetical protein